MIEGMTNFLGLATPTSAPVPTYFEQAQEMTREYFPTALAILFPLGSAAAVYASSRNPNIANMCFLTTRSCARLATNSIDLASGTRGIFISSPTISAIVDKVHATIDGLAEKVFFWKHKGTLGYLSLLIKTKNLDGIRRAAPHHKAEWQAELQRNRAAFIPLCTLLITEPEAISIVLKYIPEISREVTVGIALLLSQQQPEKILTVFPHLTVILESVLPILIDRAYINGIESDPEKGFKCMKNVILACPGAYKEALWNCFSKQIELMYFFSERPHYFSFMTGIAHVCIENNCISAFTEVFKNAFFEVLNFRGVEEEKVNRLIGILPRKYQAELFDIDSSKLEDIHNIYYLSFMTKKLEIYINSFLEKVQQNPAKLLAWKRIMTPELADRIVENTPAILDLENREVLSLLISLIPEKVIDAIRDKYPNADLYIKIKELLDAPLLLSHAILSGKNSYITTLFARFPEQIMGEYQTNKYEICSHMKENIKAYAVAELLANTSPVQLEQIENEMGALFMQVEPQLNYDLFRIIASKIKLSLLKRLMLRSPDALSQIMSKFRVTLPLGLQADYGADLPLDDALRLFAETLDNPHKLDEGAFVLLKEQLSKCWKKPSIVGRSPDEALTWLDQSAQLCAILSPELTLKLAPLMSPDQWPRIFHLIETPLLIQYLKEHTDLKLHLTIVNAMPADLKATYAQTFPVENSFFPDWDERMMAFKNRLDTVKMMEESIEKDVEIIKLKQEFSEYASQALSIGALSERAKNLAHALQLNNDETIKTVIETRSTNILQDYKDFNAELELFPNKYSIEDRFIDPISVERMRNPMKAPRLVNGKIEYRDDDVIDMKTLLKLPPVVKKDKDGNEVRDADGNVILGWINPSNNTWFPKSAYIPHTTLKEEIDSWFAGLPPQIQTLYA